MNILQMLWKLWGFKRNTRKKRAQILALQEKKLRRLLDFAYEHSAYYRRSFEAAGITRERIQTTPLSAFPTINKAELLAHYEEVVTDQALTQAEMQRFDANQTDAQRFREQYHVVHSSGSTGKPSYFAYDERAWSSMLLGIIRGALWNMSMLQIVRFLASGVRIVYIAATDGRYGGAMAVADGTRGVGAKELQLDIKTPLSQWVSQIKAFAPNLIIGYPSAIKILAELVERGEVTIQPVRVISCGEPLGSSLRQYLEEVLQAPVINIYGASESLALGVESDPEEGMILFDDLNVLEVEQGRLYLTSLENFVQPLIRYQLTDQLTLREPDADSAYPFNRAVGLVGRQEDLLWFEDEQGNREFLHPLAIEGFCIEGLLAYQICQLGRDALEIVAQRCRKAKDADIQAALSSQMQAVLLAKGLDYVHFTIRFVDEIRPDPRTGKKPLIVQTIGKETIAG